VIRLGLKDGTVEAFGVLQLTLSLVFDSLFQNMINGQCGSLLR